MKLHPFEELARAVERDRRPPRHITSWPLAVFGLLLIFQPALKAHAGDNLLGTITSTGADTTNATTLTPFAIGLSSKLTVVCDAAAFVLTDTGTAVTSTNGIPLAASEKWQTSVTGMCMWGTCTGSTVNAPNAAGKTVTSAVVRVTGNGATTNCKVYFRNGTE